MPSSPHAPLILHLFIGVGREGSTDMIASSRIKLGWGLVLIVPIHACCLLCIDCMVKLLILVDRCGSLEREMAYHGWSDRSSTVSAEAEHTAGTASQTHARGDCTAIGNGYTVKPLNNGQFGDSNLVRCREVVCYSESLLLEVSLYLPHR